MSSALESYFIAELTIGSNKAPVGLTDITMETAIACVSYHVRPFQKGTLQIHAYQGNDRANSFKPVKVLVESIKRTSSVDGTSYCQLKFSGMMSAGHGIVQLLHSIIYVVNKEEQEKNPTNKSLRTVMVSCRVCERGNIPFYALGKNTMVTTKNIFGVPKYLHAQPGRDFCDFNLIQVTVCPSCFFASNDINAYLKESLIEGKDKALFDAGAISTQWLEEKRERKKQLKNNALNFFDEKRSLEQAILSYQFAIESTDKIFNIDKHRSPRSRNYNPMRKSLYYLVVKAELQMQSGQKKQAENTLKEVIRRSAFLFPLLNDESSFRSAYLLGVLNVYFEKYKEAERYLSFLNEYNEKNKMEYGTKLHSEWKLNLGKLSEVFQDKKTFSRAALTGFDKPS